MTSVGIAFYGGKIGGAEDTARFVADLSDRIGVTPKVVTFNVETAPDAQGETLQPVEKPWEEYRRNPTSASIAVADAEPAQAFRIEVSDSPYAKTPMVGIYATSFSLTDRNITDLFGVVQRGFRPAYGFAYPCDGLHKFYSYVHGSGEMLFKRIENPFLFVNDLADWSDGPDTFREEKLRMVYPHNFLNQHHMTISVGGLPLRDWIAAAPERGRVLQLDGSFVDWIVEADSLDAINADLGAAGALISWKSPPARKRLP